MIRAMPGIEGQAPPAGSLCGHENGGSGKETGNGNQG
jgi:hypothetical protein